MLKIVGAPDAAPTTAAIMLGCDCCGCPNRHAIAGGPKHPKICTGKVCMSVGHVLTFETCPCSNPLIEDRWRLGA